MAENLRLGITPFFPNPIFKAVKNISLPWGNLTLDKLHPTNTNMTDLPFFNESESSGESANYSLQHSNFTANGTVFKWWHAFDTQYLIHSITWTVIVTVAYLVILITGLLGNSLVILTFIFRPNMRSVTNLFIMNLAVADLLAVLFCFLGNLLANTIEPWILGWFMRKAVAYVQGVSVCASAYSLAAISVDRCKAIYRPLGRPQGLRRRQATFAIIFIWLLSLSLSLPWVAGLTTVHEDGLSFCVEIWEHELYGKIFFFFVNFLTYYMIPLILIVTTNVMIWYRIKRRQVPQAVASALAIRQMHRQTRTGVRRMLGIVTLFFLLSWLPLYILVMRYRYFNLDEEEIEMLHMLMPFAQWVGSSNSSINPMLYAFLNGKFRESFRSFLPSYKRSFQRTVASNERTNNEGTMQIFPTRDSRSKQGRKGQSSDKMKDESAAK